MYQPKISDENVRRLYRLKLQEKKPMTRLLDEIINQYFESQQEFSSNTASEPASTSK